ncbi:MULTISPECIES: Crp/Fnr family transcriptional regulator [Pseudomonas]|uniref:Crp/Fnr family transcriptional regulator n=1 Tax=Pseudomonas phytophila TaxID=2867264 RepID=A0ABY6FG70_9PSED|nr:MULTISPECIES: Crp/Fnr family transcriptional regulator [Pseudomonas]MDU8362333.1 Crp/Fnr family transcriptional regulator [Pseudomonas syringae group sp. J309-1]UXZ96576.1 Crp/Fnr family transcriptional regulator [Pseudomonas phytophila]
MTNGAGWRSRLMNDPWFSHLPAALQDSLLDAARQTRKTPGKFLFEKGDEPCGLYALVEGSVRFGGAADQRLVPRLERIRMPYWFGEVSLFDGMPRRFDVYSMEQSIFLHVSQPVVNELLEKNPAHWRPFADLLSQKMGINLLRPERIKLLPAKARVAWRLLMLAEGYGHLSHARRLMSFAEIDAQRTADLSPQELLEVLQDLHQRKILRLVDEQVEIFDVVKLRKAANALRAKSLC